MVVGRLDDMNESLHVLQARSALHIPQGERLGQVHTRALDLKLRMSWHSSLVRQSTASEHLEHTMVSLLYP